jgi:hypothetical protein
MSSIAGALGDLYFIHQYKRGVILRFNMQCDDPNRETRFKFGIVLNKNTAEDEALLAITTTNQAPFASGRFEDDILRIDAATYPCFDKPTIQNLREIRPESVADLKTLCKSGQLTFHGEMTRGDLALIEQKVIRSKLIEGKYKKRIL